MDACRCEDKLWQFFCTCAVVFPPKILQQTIVTSLYDVTRISHATVRGNYKRRAWSSLRAAITVIWVFWHERLGLQQATDPLLWLSRCPLSRKHIQNAQCCLFFYKHASRPIWRTLSYCDYIYLTVTRQTTTFSPGTWYWVKHRSQPFSSELRGWDKSLVWCESLSVYLVYMCHPQCGPVIYIFPFVGFPFLSFHRSIGQACLNLP